MSAARDLYIDLFNRRPMLHPGDREAVDILRNAADLWRADQHFFSAGVCMSEAVHGAWGDGAEVDRCLVQALQDYRACVDSQPPNSFESLAALRKWTSVLTYFERSFASHWQKLLQEELAERLVKFFGDSQDSGSYLVRGFVLTTDLDENWEVIFPEHEVSGRGEFRNGSQLSIEMRSAFRLLLALGDYAGAQEIIKRCPDAFNTPGLKGWRFAVGGFLSPGEAVELFAKAADAFAEDVELPIEEIQGFRSWGSMNVGLWAKYFRARVAVARIVREPDHAKQLFKEASHALQGTEAGWVDSQVWRFRLLVNALLQVLEGGAVDEAGAHQELLGAQGLFGITTDDAIIEQFLESAARAFDAFRADPARAVTSGQLHIAMDALTRTPLIGSEVARAVAPAIGDKALTEILGSQWTWIYRTLEGIVDEAQLRLIILRLEQAHLPRYAQIRHGPLEYGKDIVAVIEVRGKRVLRMWQVKIGDINAAKWRDSRNELEEMYLVPLASLQIGCEVHEREGILVCNGHANTNVEPVMDGWFAEQKDYHGRQFRFIHLDGLVNRILDDRLVNEFRAVLDELGIQPKVGGPL